MFFIVSHYVPLTLGGGQRRLKTLDAGKKEKVPEPASDASNKL
jgi:hypothetical protein